MSLSPELYSVFMEPLGSASRADKDFMGLEPEDGLLCSVGDIIKHLDRKITLVLKTALSEIRKMVSIRIRVLKMELHKKTEEIEVLKARLDTGYHSPASRPWRLLQMLASRNLTALPANTTMSTPGEPKLSCLV